MPRKKPTRRRTNRQTPRPIIVKCGRLGSEVREFAIAKGTLVKTVLDMADIDGTTHTVKINGRKVNMSQKLTRDCTLVSIGEFKGGK